MVVAGFGELEGVGEDDAVEGDVGGGVVFRAFVTHLFRSFTLKGVKGFFDVDGGDVVGEQDDFVGVEFVLVFAEEVGGFDDSELEQADDEGAGAGEGINEVNVFIA